MKHIEWIRSKGAGLTALTCGRAVRTAVTGTGNRAGHGAAPTILYEVTGKNIGITSTSAARLVAPSVGYDFTRKQSCEQGVVITYRERSVRPTDDTRASDTETIDEAPCADGAAAAQDQSSSCSS